MTDTNLPSPVPPEPEPPGAEATAAPAPAAPPPPPPPFAGTAPAGGRGAARWAGAAVVPFLVVGLFVSGAAAERSGWLGPTTAAEATPALSGSSAELGLIEQAWQDLHQHYVDAKNLDDQALAYGAIEGMTQAVGDVGHTSFLTAAEAKAMNESLSGTFVGIGVRVTGDTNAVSVGSVIPGTPAEAAGLHRGDVIVAVDGTSTQGETIDQVVARVRGPEGQPVTLTIERAGVPNFDVTITRRKFDLPNVSWTMIPGRTVALIRLEQFATGATAATKDAITKAKAAGATSIILDLRQNPGGYVTEAVGVASQFVGDGIVYQSIDASGKTQDVAVEPGGLATDIPLVVLADGGTASAAEIVTGAIQDAGRGTVVGETTFGTGTVLGEFNLADGSVLRIGVERWLTRAGHPIWHEGLPPDVTVNLSTDAMPLTPDAVREMTAAQLAASSDAQLLKALMVIPAKG